MDENVGKIYCLDRGNDDALAAAILANGNRRDHDPMTMQLCSIRISSGTIRLLI